MTPPETFLRDWRLLVNRFHLDLTDCNEALTQLQSELRHPNPTTDYGATLATIRAQALDSLTDLRTGFAELAARIDAYGDALDREFGMSLANFRTTLTTLAAQIEGLAASDEIS